MAGPNIAPRFAVQGIAQRVERRTIPATDTLPAREVANVVVLTTGGGFAEVYFPTEALAYLPVQGEEIAYEVEVAIWNRTRRDGQGTYATLNVKAVKDLNAAEAASNVTKIA
ncbi:MAG: hypothetical protein QOJ92_240 [Frankiales bacterium]|nr:hypothetical protein [Frankiales bacterium]